MSTDYQTSVTNHTTPNEQPRRDAYTGSLQSARESRAENVGLAWQGLQTDVGNAASSFASGYNTQVTGLLSQLQGLPTLANSVEQNWATASGNARKDQAVSRATYESNFVQQQNVKWTTYSQNLQSDTSSRANSEATNYVTYQHDRALREKNAAYTAYLADLTNTTLRDAYAVAAGEFAWVSAIQTSYTSDVGGQQSAEQSYQSTATTAHNGNTYNVSLAEITHASRSQRSHMRKTLGSRIGTWTSTS